MRATCSSASPSGLRAASSLVARSAADQRPAAGVGDAEQRHATAPARVRRRSLRRRNEQRAQAGEAVAVDAAAHDQLGERVFELGWQQAHRRRRSRRRTTRRARRGARARAARASRGRRRRRAPARAGSRARRRVAAGAGSASSAARLLAARAPRRPPGAAASRACGPPCTGRRATDWRSPARAPAGSPPPTRSARRLEALELRRARRLAHPAR